MNKTIADAIEESLNARRVLKRKLRESENPTVVNTFLHRRAAQLHESRRILIINPPSTILTITRGKGRPEHPDGSQVVCRNYFIGVSDDD